MGWRKYVFADMRKRFEYCHTLSRLKLEFAGFSAFYLCVLAIWVALGRSSLHYSDYVGFVTAFLWLLFVSTVLLGLVTSYAYRKKELAEGEGRLADF